jgi:hypothetical protein
MHLGKIASIALMGFALVSCNSTESALKVDGAKPSNDPAAAASQLPAPAPNPGQQSAAISATRLQFAPIIGAPVGKVTPLSRRLTAAAKARGLTIAPSAETNVSHILKGYFSLLNENGQVTVVYVFDVLDNAGNRLHRIQGQESASASSATASWEAVPDTLMEKIADKTIADFSAWRGGAA